MGRTTIAGKLEGSDSVAARGPKSIAPIKATPKKKGKQPEKCRNAGKLSRLPDMPSDVLYEVGHRTGYITHDGIPQLMHSAFTDILSRSPGGEPFI